MGKEQINIVSNTIKEILGGYISGIQCIECREPFTVLRFINPGCTLNLWVTVIINENGQCTIQLSYIKLPIGCRRKGILTEMFSSLKSLDNMYRILITDRATQELQNWCIKNNLQHINLDYIWEKNES